MSSIRCQTRIFNPTATRQQRLLGQILSSLALLLSHSLLLPSFLPLPPPPPPSCSLYPNTIQIDITRKPMASRLYYKKCTTSHPYLINKLKSVVVARLSSYHLINSIITMSKLLWIETITKLIRGQTRKKLTQFVFCNNKKKKSSNAVGRGKQTPGNHAIATEPKF